MHTSFNRAKHLNEGTISASVQYKRDANTKQFSFRNCPNYLVVMMMEITKYSACILYNQIHPVS